MIDELLGILDSFHPGFYQKGFVNDFIDVLKDLIIPSYTFLNVKIENNEAVFPKEWDQIVAAFNNSQLFKLFAPPAYGGKGLSETDIYCLMELFGYASPGIGIIFVSHGRAVDVVLHGNEKQKSQYLPRMADGHFGAIAMTEEKAGSDPTAIELTATKNADHYLLKGQKIFTSNTGLAEFYTLTVNTLGRDGQRHISLFVVEKPTPNFFVKKLPEKDGLNVLPTGRLIFKNSPVPSDNMIGEEGQGLSIALDVLDRGRIYIAGICCGLAYRIFSEIYRHSSHRKQFAHPLTRSQDISFQISEMHTKMNAARGLCFHALKQVGTSYYRMSSSQAKLFASQMVRDVANKAQVIIGGKGYFKNDLVNRLCADARGMEYLEGTSNIQKMIIGKELYRMHHQKTSSTKPN